MSTASATTTQPQERAWAWVAHLEAGGTTTWAAWRAAAAADGSAAAGPRLPGAQQLELLRRLNLVGRPGADLARRVLAAAAIGRGRHDLGLVGAEQPARFGPVPVDPAEIGDDELLRVAAGLLAQDLLTADSSAASAGLPGATTQTNRRWRRRYRLAGDPALADPIREHLRADGRPPGGRGAAVLVLGTDLATMLGHAWTTGAFAEGGAAWSEYVDDWRARGGVPRRVDLPAAVDRWGAHPDTGRLTVVLDPGAVPSLVGLRRGPALPGPRVVSEAAADLARRTATALGLLVAAPERDRLLVRWLRPRLEGVPGPEPRVPDAQRDWVEERAAGMGRRLAASGVPVAGDLATLVPRWRPPAALTGPTPLDLAVRLLLDGPSTPSGGPVR